jgi:hypothetical protein
LTSRHSKTTSAVAAWTCGLDRLKIDRRWKRSEGLSPGLTSYQVLPVTTSVLAASGLLHHGRSPLENQPASLAVVSQVSLTPATTGFQRFSPRFRLVGESVEECKKTPENTALFGLFEAICCASRGKIRTSWLAQVIFGPEFDLKRSTPTGMGLGLNGYEALSALDDNGDG